jgi:hypothetical protein
MYSMLRIKYNEGIKSNFIYLPKSLQTSDSNLAIARVGKKSTGLDFHFFASLGHVSSDPNVIEINPTLARSIGLKPNEFVKISIEPEHVEVDSIILEPLSNYDYIIIEENSSFFEEHLLDQIMIVYDQLVFPFLLFDNRVVYIKVKSDIKHKALLLTQNCEVEVVYKPPEVKEEAHAVYLTTSQPLRLSKNSSPLAITVSRSLLDSLKLGPGDTEGYMANVSLKLPTEGDSLGYTLLFRLSDSSSVNKVHAVVESSERYEDKRFSLEHNILNKIPNRSNFWVNILVDDSIEGYICMHPSMVVRNTIILEQDNVNLLLFKHDSFGLENTNYKNFIKDNLVVDYYTSDRDINLEKVRSYLIDNLKKSKQLILNLDYYYTVIIDWHEVIFKLTFLSDMSKYYELLNKLKINPNKAITDKSVPILEPFVFISDEAILQSIKYKFKNELLINHNYITQNKLNRYLIDDNSCITDPSNFNDLELKVITDDINKSKMVKKAKSFFKHKSSIGISFISFPKEYNTRLFYNKLNNAITSGFDNGYVTAVFVNLDMFNMNNYNDLTVVDNYLKGLFKHYLRQIYRVLFIFEGLIKKPDTNEGGFKNDIYLTISTNMKKYLRKFHKRNQQEGNKFYFTFSIKGLVNDYIFHNLLFDKVKIGFIDEPTCIEILGKIVGENVDNDLAEFCKNFVFSDFIKIHKNLTTMESLKEYLGKYIPTNLSDEKIIKLENDFSTIGGLLQAKEEVTDTISLSMKCEKLFGNKLPIKLSSGILLIGPSGCGKTLLASAMAKQFRINFYSIKGPEILNKYIGASEAAIREIFENAKKTTPCIVFFDEFDSIGPKRGTGSSGVTDRVSIV